MCDYTYLRSYLRMKSYQRPLLGSQKLFCLSSVDLLNVQNVSAPFGFKTYSSETIFQLVILKAIPTRHQFQLSDGGIEFVKKVTSLERSGCIFISPCVGACETTDNAPHPQDLVFSNQWGTTTLRP